MACFLLQYKQLLMENYQTDHIQNCVGDRAVSVEYVHQISPL